MNRTLLLGFAAVVAWSAASSASAAEIAFTSFENETPDAQYVDTGDPNVPHALLNNAGQSPVNSTASSTLAGDLGFSASYTPTGSNGLTDGDFVGVTDFTGVVTAFTDGVQGYQLSDTDGIMQVDFDPVVISGLPGVEVSLDYFVQSTGWETDVIRIFATVDGNETDLLNTAGSDIDDLNIEGSWLTASDTFTGNSLTLSVLLESNSASEALFIDNVKFTAVPEPSGLAALACAGVVAAARRRKRN